MAIFSAVPPPEHQPANPATTSTPPVQSPPTPVKNSAIDIDAWTVSALQSLSVSPVARGIGSPLAIPIDEALRVKEQSAQRNVSFPIEEAPIEASRRPLSRRDSMKRRDSLLKGNEGSRQRRRWENGTVTMTSFLVPY